MNYWVLSPNVDNGKNETAWKKAILSLHYAFMGYGTDHNLGSMFSKSVAIGDMILIAQGKNSNKRLFLCGIVETKATWEHKKNTPGDAQNRKLINVLTKPELENLNLNLNGCAYGESSQPAAIYQLKPNENLNDLRVINTLLHEMKMKENISILEHKKQIILQGPPGTGKTRMAKEIAATLTKPSIQNHTQKITSFLQNYQVNDEISKHREFVLSLENEFLDKFKKEALKNLSLEEYALGLDDKDGFCYWLEYNLIHTGKYNGTATKGKIYWNANDEEYKKSGFIKDIINDDEAMEKVADLLHRIVNEKFEKPFEIGKGFVLKILSTYYSEKYFPISSEDCLNNALLLFDISIKGLNYVEKNKKLQNRFLILKSKYGSDITNYEFMYFLFDNFDLKRGIRIENNNVITQGESQLIQFHPSYTYEDFVRGITVKSNGNKVSYETENKVLANFAQKALDSPSSNYVLIIDEINRANLSSVLGELIYALEYRGEAVESMYEIDGDRKIILPPNLFIIGTMNTADRSVGQIDYAIRRRFSFVDVLPKVLSETDLNSEKKEKEPRLFFKEEVFLKVQELFKNDKEENSEHLSEEFQAKDVQLGHSYFIYTEDNFKFNLDYEIKPILKEYVTDGILKTSALSFIEEL